MRQYELYDLLIKSATVAITVLGGIIGYFKFKRQLNRTMYEKRLSQVYAPLIGLIVKQELFREWFPEELAFERSPILELMKEKEKVKLENGKIKVDIEEYKLIDRNLFSKIIKEINLGFARPALVKYTKQYELIVDIQNEIPNNNELFKKTCEAQINIEKKLLKEIIDGYSETVTKLGLDGNSKLKEIKYKYIEKDKVLSS